MKRFVVFGLAVFLVCVHVATAFSESLSKPVYQSSTLAALMSGAYDGPTTFGELRKKGDFGIGTVNGLDGEMIALDGQFYQIRVDGKAVVLQDSVRTPFAVVVFFTSEQKHSINDAIDKKALQESVDRLLDTKDRFYAIKVHGTFSSIKVRSVPKQNKPYVSLKKALEGQSVFDLQNVKGTLVGFRFPAYMGGVNVPGYHFHFITEDRSSGGHVLACTLASGTIELAGFSDFFLNIPSVERLGTAQPRSGDRNAASH